MRALKSFNYNFIEKQMLSIININKHVYCAADHIYITLLETDVTKLGVSRGKKSLTLIINILKRETLKYLD